MSKDTILVIGDIHAPYEHSDAVEFLKAVKDKYKPTTVIQIGDEVDSHALSFHTKNPDLHSAKDELDKAIEHLQPLYKLFPKVQVMESNHGSLVYRRAEDAGLPSQVIKGYRDILRAPKGWNWHFDLVIKTALGEVYFHHGKSATVGALSKNMSMNAVQGHYHKSFYIYYWANPKGLYWDMNVGCLADSKALAMAYGKNNIPRPIVGCGLIKNGRPQLIPMELNSKGTWVQKL